MQLNHRASNPGPSSLRHSARNVTLWVPLEDDRRPWETCSVHLYSQRKCEKENQPEEGSRPHVCFTFASCLWLNLQKRKDEVTYSSKLLSKFKGLHGIISQKILFKVIDALRPSKTRFRYVSVLVCRKPQWVLNAYLNIGLGCNKCSPTLWE
jgi:hypothetical protein